MASISPPNSDPLTQSPSTSPTPANSAPAGPTPASPAPAVPEAPETTAQFWEENYIMIAQNGYKLHRQY